MKIVISLKSLIKKTKSWLQRLNHARKRQQLSSFTYDLHLGDREYYIAFINPDEDYVAQKLLKPGFRHCFIFYRGSQCWLMLNPTRWFLHIMELHCEPGDPFPEHLKANHPEITILRVTARLLEARLMYFRPLTCVSHTAYILGLTNRFIITPHQLYRCLLRGKNPNIINVQEII